MGGDPLSQVALLLKQLWRILWGGGLAWPPAWTRPATLGQRGELAARRFLRRQGYVILAERHRSPFGEIDLIALQGRTLVFIEVKTRRSRSHGDPSEAVDRRKQQRIRRSAMAYMKHNRLLPSCAARFDIISILWPENGQPEIRHLIGAF